MRKLPLSLLAFFFSSTLAHSADVVLVDNGQPKAAIFVAPAVMADNQKPSNVTLEREQEEQRQRLRETVKDLALYLEKISGTAIPVNVTETPEMQPGVTPILIGPLAAKKFGPPKTRAPYKQGFRMVVSPQGVGFCGESDLATSYAIYELLDRLGCRWYMPGDLGAVVPEMKSIKVAEIDFDSAPGTIYRGVWYADDAFKRRNRLGGLLLSAGHALEYYVSKEDRELHPEWRAEVRGKPHAIRLRWSNAGVAQAIADKIISNLDKNYTNSVSLSPEDGVDFDESAEDRAIDAGDLDTTWQDVSITDRLIVLCNRVAEKVTTKYPDVMFGMLAYGNYTRPPVREKLHPSIVPQIAPITYSRAHPMTDDAVPDNKQLRYLIEGWGKQSKYTSVYYYGWFLAEPAAPNPMIKKWSIDVPMALKHGCQFWQPETQPNFESSMHGLYLGFRLAWNPKLAPADVFNELHEKFYGHAAKEMAAYWHFIDEIWVNTNDYSGCGFGYLRRWTPEKLAQARVLLDAGLAACKTPLEVQRVRLADESLGLMELFMKLRRDQAEGRFAKLASEGEYWLKHCAMLGQKNQDQMTFTYMPRTGGGINISYARQFYQLTYNDATRIATEGVILTPKPLINFRYQADEKKTGEAQDFAKADFDDSAWKTTDVTSETWSTLGYHAWFKSMWYRTEVQLPPTPAVAKGKKVYLWLGSTDGSAKVFVNGQHISHTNAKGETVDEFNGYCQPASFDITAALQPKGPTKIAILTTRTFFNELGTGGLLGPVVVYREK